MSTYHHVMLIAIILHVIKFCAAPPCYNSAGHPQTCITYPIDAALGRKISATNTCGKTLEKYCYIGAERACSVCNALDPQRSHPASLMVDQFNMRNVTWWQSQSWWQTNQEGLSRMYRPLTVNVTLSIDKSYLISGGIYVTFNTERPKQMVIERSRDFGKTWEAYQYYAKNCRSAYNMQADPPINTLLTPFKQICSQKFSGEFPRSGGSVYFDPRTRYDPEDYYNRPVHHYLEATDIRIRLEYPGTDGREYINQESTLNQYYYAISSIRVDARCNCNGHAEFCDMRDGYEFCDCKHFTMGTNCEICLPMYKNRPWKEGTLIDANPCESKYIFDKKKKRISNYCTC